MKRFILLTFGFLGWAFYEMSGGGDFEAASDRYARLNPTPEFKIAEAPETAEVVTAQAPQAVVDTDPPASSEVTRVSLNLTTLRDVTQNSAASATQAATITNIDPESGVAVNSGLTLSSVDTPAIIPSLIQPDDTGAATLLDAAVQSNTSAEVRKVSGNRVNVRGGPGTNFGVVGKLVRGDAVEIIEDNGNGWVLMRSLDGSKEGWLADFLLTAG